MGEAFQIVGFLGSLLLSASLVPQMMKLYKTKSARDISLSYQISYVVGLAMIVAYGFGRWLWPVYIPATIELCAALVVFSMKLYYDWQDKQNLDVSKATGVSPELEVEVALPVHVSRSQCDEAAARTLQ
ncbi:Isoleucine--tRNA ligase [Phytophthora cinnamomi]|uniref:Isoleucine--tRNA ligase n=1 Tax=Phytophthora cinnamomi TaxID=4785 RepID=UPI00355A4BAC|nr:Isoleucine--tRNA ligase [Phytophthora cinnamomi]